LEALDNEYLEVEKEYNDELSRLNQRFEAQFGVLLSKRNGVLTRQAQPGPLDHLCATRALPGFWRMVLLNSDEFQEDIERHDEPVLDYLTDIVWELLDESCRDKGFRIRFVFAPNPYFSNELLTKEYHYEKKNPYVSDPEVCTKIVASPIDWHTGKNVTVELIAKKPKSGRRRVTKPKREEVPRPSFFRRCFRNLGPGEEIPEEELDEEEDHEDPDLMQYLLEDDHEQGVALRDYLIPHAVRWFTGEAIEDDEEASESEEGAESSEEDDDEEDEEDDEDEDEATAAASRKAAQRQGPAAGHRGVKGPNKKKSGKGR